MIENSSRQRHWEAVEEEDVRGGGGGGGGGYSESYAMEEWFEQPLVNTG